MNEKLEKYSQSYLHKQQNQYDHNQQIGNQQQKQLSQGMDNSRHSNAKDQYDMRQLYTMLQQSQEHNENLKNIIDDMKKQLKEYKQKCEQSNKENEQLKAQNKHYSDKNNIYIMRINTFEESEQNLKQKISDLNGKYDYLKGKYQDLSKKYKNLESQQLALQQSKKENDQPVYKNDNRLFTNPSNDDSPSVVQRQNNAGNTVKQQLSQVTKNQNLKKVNSIDLSSQNGSVQDIDKFAFQVLKQQHNHQQNNLTPQNQNTSQNSINELNQLQKPGQYQNSQMSNSKISHQQDNRKQSLSPRSYSQMENTNATAGGGVQLLKNNYVNQMQTTTTAVATSNQTPMRSSTSVPALFRAPKNEIQQTTGANDSKVPSLNYQQKNMETSTSNSSQNHNSKSLSDNKQPPLQKSLLFPHNNSTINYQDEGQYSSVNKYSSNIGENLNDQSSTKLGEINFTSNTYSKPPIMKKSDHPTQSTQEQQRQIEVPGYGRINSHRATIDSITPSHQQNLNSYDNHTQSTKSAYPPPQNSGVYPVTSNVSTTVTGDQSYMASSQGYTNQQFMSQSSKYVQQQTNNPSLSSSLNHTNKQYQPSHSSLSTYQPSHPSQYDVTYSESSFSNNQNFNSQQGGNKDLYSSINQRQPHPNRYHSSNDHHMYSTNPLPNSSDYDSQVNQPGQSIHISSFNKNAGNSGQKPQINNGLKALSVTEFSNNSSINHQLPKYTQGDYDRFNPHSETKIDSEVHTPQKPNIFQSKSVFNNNQLNIQPHTSTNVNQSSVYKENDFAEHLISNDGIQVKKRSQVLHASRRDPNTTGQYSPSSPRKQQQLTQYEDKQLMKALFGNDHQNLIKESGIPGGSTKNQDQNQNQNADNKMFEQSQRIENEFDSSKNQDRVIPSINPGGFGSSQNSYSNSNNSSYNQQQIEKRSQSIKNLSQPFDSDSLTNLDSASDNRQKLRISERNNNNLKTIQIQPFGQSSTPSQFAAKVQKMAKIIDNFIVISANQEKTRLLSKQNVFNVDQEIIFKAAEPKSDMENEQLKVISKFCYPQGVEVHKYKRENFSSDILKMINTHKELQSKEYFVFPIKSAESFEKKNNQIIKEQEGLDDISNPNKFLYCVCVVARDYIDPGNQQRMYKSENSAQPQHYYQASSTYCIITKYPFFNFFFDLILQFINKMNISKKNLMQDSQLKNILPTAQDYQQIDLSSFKKHINQSVLKVVHSCMKGEIAIDFNIVHRFTIGQEFLSLTIPQKENCYLLEAKWGVMQTLTIMNVYEFLYILFSFFLEESLVFLSKNASTLSQTMMMFLSALKPFKWPHPFVMFLTNDLMHMFDSPFPLIIGINKSYDFIKENKLYKTHSHCIFVNLDEFGISEKKESIYQSNTYTSLTTRIKGDYEQLKQVFNKKDAYNDYSSQLIEISSIIFDKIRKFFQETLAKLLPQKPILDAKNNLDYDQMKNIVLKNSSQGDQFIEKFIQSQTFSYYLEEYYNV